LVGDCIPALVGGHKAAADAGQLAQVFGPDGFSSFALERDEIYGRFSGESVGLKPHELTRKF
jgi:hypothetical protein